MSKHKICASKHQLVRKLVPEGLQLRFSSIEMTTRLQRFHKLQIFFRTFQTLGMADVVAWIAGSKPSLVQEKVQAVLIRCRVMCWTSCSRCVALAIWIYGDKQRGVSICMWALWCRVCQCHDSFSPPCRPHKKNCSEAFVNKDVASLDDLPQGSLAHRYTGSSLHELNLTDIFFFRRLVANVCTCLVVFAGLLVLFTLRPWIFCHCAQRIHTWRLPRQGRHRRLLHTCAEQQEWCTLSMFPGISSILSRHCSAHLRIQNMTSWNWKHQKIDICFEPGLIL